MHTIVITRERMLADVNDKLSRLYEMATFGGEHELDPDLYYPVDRYWVNPKGDTIVLSITGREFAQAAWLGDTGSSEACDWIKRIENNGNHTFLERFWRSIKKL